MEKGQRQYSIYKYNIKGVYRDSKHAYTRLWNIPKKGLIQ